MAAPHHALIAEKLEAVERGDIKRLMIFMPPRHGKSELASRSFPAWFLGRNPDKQIIASSYNSDLAGDFGREVRNIVGSPEYKAVFQTSLSADSQAADRWHTNNGGSYVAAGVGTAITGRGAHIFLIDDPVKDREEADSDLKRKRVKDWYTSTAYTRLMPGGAIVIIQTRWHIDDLSGWLLNEQAKGGEKWEVLSLPAITDGCALWPDWYSLERLGEIKNVIGPRDWSALYQQSPTPDGGGAFKRDWPQTYDETPDDVAPSCNKYILVDAANEKRKTSDYTAIWVVGVAEDGNYYILDMYRDRMNLTERASMVMKLHRKWKPRQVRYERYGLMADVQHIKIMQGQQNYRFEITEVAGQTPKNDRIKRLIPIFEEGKVYFPKSMHRTDHEGKTHDLVQVFIEEEMLAFPVGRHDDMIDALSRIAEPELPLIWPRQEEKPEPYDRYKRQRQTTAWAA